MSMASAQVNVRPTNGKEVQLDILVMENIFYNRDLFPIYDLKGSERSRLARDDPSDPSRVLMDQNLMQSNLNDPILVSTIHVIDASECVCGKLLRS